MTSKDQNAGGSWSDSPEDGGQGGDKGSPGAGGKVYRATIDVVPGQVIHYECGTPGVGGATNGAVGAAGGETTFGDLSSAQGASSEIGYVDPVTEEELAKPGTEGVNGAAGGRGGQASSRRGEYGESGEDVPPNTGGPGGPPYGWKFDDYTSENVRIYGGGAGGGAAHGKDGEPGSDSPTAVGGAGASPDVPKTPDKIELEEMAGTAVAVAVGPEDCLHLRRLMARQNYRPVSGSRRTADRRGKGLLVQMAGRAV